MGATNCPETPRQKMIQMMYLVYTAMLALNVSVQILDAFVVVDDTLAVSTKNAISQNATTYNWFEMQHQLNGGKVAEAYTNAKKVKKESDEMVKYLENLRQDLIFFVDGDTLYKDKATGKMMPKTVATIKARENFDKPTDYMINKGHAKELKNKINQYKDNLLKFAKPSDRKELKVALGLDVDQKYKKDGFTQTWEEHSFDHIVAAAAVTLLNKTIGEVRNAEAQMLSYLKASISADDFKFDHVEGRAIPKSQMVFSGDSYEADIIVAAYDTKATPEVYYKMGADTLTVDGIGSATKLEGENGVVKLKLSAGGTGDQKYAGLIKILDPSGQPKYYGFSDKYTVLKPSAVISADKMNVLYAGIANPVSVSAPVDPNKLSVSFPGCSAKSTGGGTFNVSVPASLIGKTLTATVSARLGESSKSLGSTTFRVKKVPNPRAVLGAGIRSGKRSKAEILANPLIRATMGDDFAYDLKWKVTSFQVIFVSKGMEDAPMTCQGGALSEAVKAKIQKSTSNTVVYFTGIKASSEAGSRTLDEFSIRIR